MARPQFRTLLRWLVAFAEPISNPTTRASFALCLVFFASGASALIFETLWFHQARLVVGSSVWAATLVPAAFMAGLGIGNAIAMRRGDQIARPLRVYAILELLVAVCGVFLIYALPSLASILAPVFRPLLERTAGLAALRFIVAFVLLAGPATAMGLTLPLLTRTLSGSNQNFGRILGRLYGYNTLGAVAGAIISGAFLIGQYGIRGSGCIAGALNLVAVVGALLLAPRLTPSSDAPVATAENVGLRHYAPHAKWLAMAFLSGATLLALEVIWFRFLSLYAITNSLAFALMLAIVLSGIAIGGLVASQWLRWSPLAHRHCIFVATAAVLATVLTYAVSPHVTAYFDIQVAKKASHILELGIPLMLPVSILSGILFTLTGAALEHRTQRQAATTGVLTLFNTAGATFGATFGGFLLIPQIGMEKSFFLMALFYAIVAALSFPREEKGAWRRGIVCAFVCIASLISFPFGSMENDHFEVPIRRWSQRTRGVVAFREGLTETILYIERKFADRTRSQRLVTNAISMSSSDYRNGRYMKLYVYLPAAIHPQLEDALLISFGVGTTAKALTDTRELRRIDVVDISREILDMSRVVFPNPADNPLHDPRVLVHVEDGRFFLQTTQRSYDLITSEPPPPNIDGVVNLYSREYFTLVRNRLKEGGIVTYWLPTHSMAEHNSLAVARAFCDVFEDCSV